MVSNATAAMRCNKSNIKVEWWDFFRSKMHFQTFGAISKDAKFLSWINTNNRASVVLVNLVEDFAISGNICLDVM